MRPALLLAAAAALAGCKTPADARLVTRTSDSGVIAMSRDTPENRSRAEALMRSHFPEGYEIVWEGEEAYYAPAGPPRPARPIDDPIYVHQQRMLDATYGAGTDSDFQRSIDDLPGAPRSARGYGRDPAPAVAVHVHDGHPPAGPPGILRNEWRITYRRKGPAAPEAVQAGGTEAASGSESLFPAYHRERADPSEPAVVPDGPG